MARGGGPSRATRPRARTRGGARARPRPAASPRVRPARGRGSRRSPAAGTPPPPASAGAARARPVAVRALTLAEPALELRGRLVDGGDRRGGLLQILAAVAAALDERHLPRARLAGHERDDDLAAIGLDERAVEAVLRPRRALEAMRRSVDRGLEQCASAQPRDLRRAQPTGHAGAERDDEQRQLGVRTGHQQHPQRDRGQRRARQTDHLERQGQVDAAPHQWLGPAGEKTIATTSAMSTAVSPAHHRLSGRPDHNSIDTTADAGTPTSSARTVSR